MAELLFPSTPEKRRNKSGNFLLSQQLVGSLQPKRNIPYSRPLASFNQLTCNNGSKVQESSQDLKIELILNPRSFQFDSLNWQNKQVAYPITNVFSQTTRNRNKNLLQQKYRYCTHSDSPFILSPQREPSQKVKIVVKNQDQQINYRAEQTALKTQRSLMTNSQRLETQTGSALNSPMTTRVCLNQNLVKNSRKSTIESINVNSCNGRTSSKLSIDKQQNATIYIIDSARQSFQQQKFEIQVNPQSKFATKLEDKTDVGYVTIPLNRSENDRSIQCSETEILSHMGPHAAIIPYDDESFGVNEVIEWQSPKISRISKKKLHLAIKPKLVDPFSLDEIDRGNQFVRNKLKLRRRNEYANSKLHKTIGGVQLSPQQQIQNFQSILKHNF